MTFYIGSRFTNSLWAHKWNLLKMHVALNDPIRSQFCTYQDRWAHKIVIWLYIYVQHDDVIKWKHFPRHWPFVRGINRSLVNSPHKGQWHGALIFLFDLHRNQHLGKQWRRRWFETSLRSLWRHCNEFRSISITPTFNKQLTRRLWNVSL